MVAVDDVVGRVARFEVDVAIAGHGVDHRFAAYPQAEHGTTSAEFAGQGQQVVDVFVGSDQGLEPLQQKLPRSISRRCRVRNCVRRSS